MDNRENQSRPPTGKEGEPSRVGTINVTSQERQRNRGRAGKISRVVDFLKGNTGRQNGSDSSPGNGEPQPQIQDQNSVPLDRQGSQVTTQQASKFDQIQDLSERPGVIPDEAVTYAESLKDGRNVVIRAQKHSLGEDSDQQQQPVASVVPDDQSSRSNPFRSTLSSSEIQPNQSTSEPEQKGFGRMVQSLRAKFENRFSSRTSVPTPAAVNGAEPTPFSPQELARDQIPPSDDHARQVDTNHLVSQVRKANQASDTSPSQSQPLFMPMAEPAAGREEVSTNVSVGTPDTMPEMKQGINMKTREVFKLIDAGKWDIAALGLGFAGRAVAMRLGVPPEALGDALKYVASGSGILSATWGALEYKFLNDIASLPEENTAEVTNKVQEFDRAKRVFNVARRVAQKASLLAMGASLGYMAESGQLSQVADAVVHAPGDAVGGLGSALHDIGSVFSNEPTTVILPAASPAGSLPSAEPGSLPSVEPSPQAPVSPAPAPEPLPSTIPEPSALPSTVPAFTPPTDNPPGYPGYQPPAGELPDPIASPGHPGFEPGVPEPEPIPTEDPIAKLAGQVSATQMAHANIAAAQPQPPVGGGFEPVPVPVTPEPTIVSPGPIDHVENPLSGHVVNGEVGNPDNPLTFDGMKWELSENGVDQISDLLSQYGDGGQIDNARLNEMLQAAAAQYANGTLDDESPLGKLFHLCNGTTSMQDEVFKPETIDKLRELGVIK